MGEGESGGIVPAQKPTLSQYLSEFLPFQLPEIPLVQTAKNLDKAIGKIVLAGGDKFAKWLERGTRLSDAKADATVELMRKGSDVIVTRIDGGDTSLGDRAIAAALGEQVSRQTNRESISKMAIEELQSGWDDDKKDAEREIDDDWLNAFSEQAGRVSNEDMQRLWARVLAGEIRKPGEFKIRTLQALSLIQFDEAQLIHKYMDLVVEERALYVGPKTKLAVFSELLELENMGVLQGVGQAMSLKVVPTSQKPVFIHLAAQSAIRIVSDKDDEIVIKDVCVMTSFGKALSKLARPGRPSATTVEMLANSLKREGAVLDLVEFGPVRSDGNMLVTLIRRL